MKNSQSTKHSAGDKQRDSRRSFLRKSAVVGGGLASAAALSGEVFAEQEQEVSKPREQGYRLTKHISEYYKAARL